MTRELTLPTAAQVRAYRDAAGGCLSLQQARRHLIRQSIVARLLEATSWEDAQPALVLLAKVVDINT